MPVRIEARLGEHSELVTKQLSNRHPSWAISSMRGVRLTTDPYALMECAAWSSVKIITMFGRRWPLLDMIGSRFCGGLCVGVVSGQSGLVRASGGTERKVGRPCRWFSTSKLSRASAASSQAMKLETT